MKTVSLMLACILALGFTTSAGAAPDQRVTASPARKLSDTVAGAWQLYRSIFMTADGRIVDRENGSISHSEGQGYGMLIAVAADDRQSFESLWAWTESQLQVREDSLAAWKWDPAATPHVTDRNNATDGDILIAWALLRAFEKWNVEDYRREARAIVDDIVAKATAETDYGTVILPGVAGFAAKDRADGPVVNLSYWVFPALEDLGEAFPDLKRLDLVQSGTRLLTVLTQSPDKLPTDWTSLAGDRPHPADGFPDEFGYNAIRIPLYVVWGGMADRPLLESLAAPFGREGAGSPPTVVDVATGEPEEALDASGYRAIGIAIGCALGDERVSIASHGFDPSTYYASTLHILTLMALSERYPQCF